MEDYLTYKKREVKANSILVHIFKRNERFEDMQDTQFVAKLLDQQLIQN